MNSYVFTFIVTILFWALSMVNTSGLGEMYDTPTKTFFLMAILYFIVKRKTHVPLPISGKNKTIFRLAILSFVLLPVIFKGDWDGFTYLLTALLVYVFSQQKITSNFMTYSGYAVAGLGAFIMFVYSRTEVLSGWNDNQISMIGLFSYLYYAISLFGNMSGSKLTIGLIVSLFFFSILTSATESRGAAIFITLSVVAAYRPAIARNFANKTWFVKFAIALPMIIALIVAFIPNLAIFEFLNEVSEQGYQKTVFNGRDGLWYNAFIQLPKDYFLGAMEFKINYHNSAVAALAVYGVIGYYCWHTTFVRGLSHIRRYISDDIVFGCFMSFILIFWQQSFDLGFIMGCPNYIPYMILGIGFGRINTLQRYGNG